MPPKTEKSALNVHLMTPSSANIGQTDLLFSAQIDVHQRSTYHHRPLGRGQKCANVPTKFTEVYEQAEGKWTDGRPEYGRCSII